MGSLPRPPRLNPDQIAEAYRAGESRGLLGLRAGVGDSVIVAILRDAGVTLRSGAESKRLSHQARMATMSRRRPRR
jgi:hypothetical protein